MADADVTLARIEVVGALAPGRTDGTMVWADVMGTAWLNAKPLARYVAFMIVAGVIACYGVIDNNGILIVGAMAVSPDRPPALRPQLQHSFSTSSDSSPPATASRQRAR